MKLTIEKKVAVITAGMILLCGCMPSISVKKSINEKEGKAVIEYKLGQVVEMDEWVSLKKKVCDDLSYATQGLPVNLQQDILKYSCIENDKYELGATLEKLQPGQIEQICAKLSEKGYNAKDEKEMTRAAELATTIGISVLAFLIFK